MRRSCMLIMAFVFYFAAIKAQTPQRVNNPDREKWFQELAFGMFVHWNVDVALGGVIGHSLAGASADYINRYFEELPQHFNPDKFAPQKWAKLAKLAGMKYAVFTAKHHSGFCMFDSKTTAFNITHTPYKKDITKEFIDAFRTEGIAIGLYFSPEDFWYFHQQQIPIGRLQNDLHYPMKNAGLMEYDKRQLKELLTQYGTIDILFIDGPGDGLREYAWSINPALVITRDAMVTPEQKIPDSPIPGPWEACYTSGTEWSYKAGNDHFKSGQEAINKLIEIRCKGGNLLLNVGPSPEGEIRPEESNILREIGMWMMANRESIYQLKPLPLVKEGNVYYAQSAKDSAIYAYVLRADQRDWAYGTRKTITMPSLYVDNDAAAKVGVLGYASELVEYRVNFDAQPKIHSSPFGLMVSAVNGQRFYTDNTWSNPVVLKIEGAKQLKKKRTQGEGRSRIDGAQ